MPLILTNANLIDCVNEGVTPDASVVIDDDRIVEVGASGATPPSSAVIDLRGAFLLPVQRYESQAGHQFGEEEGRGQMPQPRGLQLRDSQDRSHSSIQAAVGHNPADAGQHVVVKLPTFHGESDTNFRLQQVR